MSTKESSQGALISSKKLLESSESNFRNGSYKKAVSERRKARELIGTLDKFKTLVKELILNNSKYNLIADYKMKISELKRSQIIKYLEEKSNSQYDSGDYKGCIKINSTQSQGTKIYGYEFLADSLDNRSGKSV